MAQDQPKQNVSKTLSQKVNQVQWLTPVIPAPLEADIERIAVQAQPKPKS
jgi:hypothetical protein